MTHLARSDRKNEIVFVAGRKGSGKSTLLARVFVPQHPRVITLDFTAEAMELYPHAIEARGVRGVLATMRECTQLNKSRWHIVAYGIDEDDAVQLVDALAPPLDDGRTSLSAILGGVAIECGEVDLLAPNGQTPRVVRNAFKRGRHHRLSLLCGTLRPAECDRIVTAMADVIVAFSMDEPRDVDYLRRACGPTFAAVVQRLPRHFSVWHDRRDHTRTVRDSNYRAVPMAQFMLDSPVPPDIL